MIFKNATVLNEDFRFVQGNLEIQDGKIKQIGIIPEQGEVLDCTGKYILPGLVDTHFHAAVGKTFIDLNEGACEDISKYEALHGTTSLCPALSAAPTQKMLDAIGFILDNKQKAEYAKYVGIHLEGPFFNVKYKGAHLPENIRNCDLVEFKQLVEQGGGFVKMITLAPELPGSEEVVKYAASVGVQVSIGHTNATYEEVNRAQSWGASRATHTFNAMSPLNHRAPGTVGGVLMNENINCEVICDFVHVHPDMVKMVYKLKGVDGMTMVTDSELGAGFADGVYVVNGRELIVQFPKTMLPDGTLAGGTTCLLDGVKNLIQIGIPAEHAVKMASFNPAKAIGMEKEIGSLAVGKRADILITDKEWNLEHCFVDGKQCC